MKAIILRINVGEDLYAQLEQEAYDQSLSINKLVNNIIKDVRKGYLGKTT